MLKPHFELMAKYNQWMNSKLYDCAATLSTETLTEDKGAFFGSILGTLNHVMVADVIWLQRFAGHPSQFDSLDSIRSMATPGRLDQILHHDLEQLRTHRGTMDETITRFIGELSEANLASDLDYHNTKGDPFKNKLSHLLQHFFNHQTHHRGQITTLLSQSNVDVGITDLLVIIRDLDA